MLVHDDVLSRLKWKLGLVTELYVGADGLVRSAEVKIERTLTNRPVSKFYPLEVSAQDTDFTDGAVLLAIRDQSVLLLKMLLIGSLIILRINLCQMFQPLLLTNPCVIFSCGGPENVESWRKQEARGVQLSYT